jgi:hypothetical protein
MPEILVPRCEERLGVSAGDHPYLLILFYLGFLEVQISELKICIETIVRQNFSGQNIYNYRVVQ